MSNPGRLQIRAAGIEDIPLILGFIRELAEYEKLATAVVADENQLRSVLFGSQPAAEVLLGYWEDTPVAFAVFFHNFSTFLGRPGLFLEDLYVRAQWRGRGIGRAMLQHLAELACQRGHGRMEWAVLDWNEPAIGFYKKLGATPMKDWTIFRIEGKALAELAGEGCD